MLVCQLDIHVEEITSRDMINALTWNPNPYLSLPEHWLLLNREYLHIERQGIQLCNKIVVFLMREVSLDFQRFHWNRVASVPTEWQRLTTDFEGFAWLQRRHRLISRPGSWLFYMSIIYHYAQEHVDPPLPPSTYFIVNKEQRHSFSTFYFSHTATRVWLYAVRVLYRTEW